MTNEKSRTFVVFFTFFPNIFEDFASNGPKYHLQNCWANIPFIQRNPASNHRVA